MADKANQADEPPPPPTESDVCFGDKHHPGTQHFLQVVEQIATFPWVEGYSPEVYCAINKELKHRRFFFHSKKQGKWVVAKKKKKNREFEKAFEMQREKLSEDTAKALESRVSVEDVIDLEKGEPNVIQDAVELEEDPPTQAPLTVTPALESRVSVEDVIDIEKGEPNAIQDVVELEEDPPTQAPLTATPVYAINPRGASRATATEEATDIDPACVNLFLCLLGGVSLALFLFVAPPFSKPFLGVFWTWVALGILFLLRLMGDEKFGSPNTCCTCGTIYGLTIGIMFVLFFIASNG